VLIDSNGNSNYHKIMTGTIKHVINEIYLQRANGNQHIIDALKVKLVLKGIYPDTYSDTSPDDPTVIEKIKMIANEMGIII
jgi:hypothetical protein